MKSWLKLIASIVICNLAGILGSIFTMNSVSTWYQTINRPSFTPPGWIFGPVWTTLYTLMGISLYLIWTSKSKLKKPASIVFWIQLFLNFLWTPLFFGLKNLQLAFIEIILLWLSIITTIYYFYKIDKRAAYLLIPYLLWVSFAAFLNYSFLRLN